MICSICSRQIGPFLGGVFRVNFPWLGGAEDDEGEKIGEIGGLPIVFDAIDALGHHHAECR